MTEDMKKNVKEIEAFFEKLNRDNDRAWAAFRESGEKLIAGYKKLKEKELGD